MRCITITSRRDMATGTVGAWIGVGVACSSTIASVTASSRPKPSKEVNEELSACALMRPSLDAPRPACSQRHLARLGANGNERASQRPFDGNPHTRLPGAERAVKFYMGRRCVRFKAHSHFPPCRGASCFLPGRCRRRWAGGTMLQLTACVWIFSGTFSATGVGQAIC